MLSASCKTHHPLLLPCILLVLDAVSFRRVLQYDGHDAVDLNRRAADDAPALRAHGDSRLKIQRNVEFVHGFGRLTTLTDTPIEKIVEMVHTNRVILLTESLGGSYRQK